MVTHVIRISLLVIMIMSHLDHLRSSKVTHRYLSREIVYSAWATKGPRAPPQDPLRVVLFLSDRDLVKSIVEWLIF